MTPSSEETAALKKLELAIDAAKLAMKEAQAAVEGARAAYGSKLKEVQKNCSHPDGFIGAFIYGTCPHCKEDNL